MSDTSPRLRLIIPLLLAVPILVVPLLGDRYLINVLEITLVFAIYASAWNLFAYAGQASLGHATFLGVGAYASVLLSRSTALPPLVSILVGGFVSVVAGLLVGLACVRLRGWFLGIVTFGFSVLAEVIVSEPLSWLTHGRYGVWAPRLIPPEVPGYFVYEYYIVVSTATLAILVMHKIMKSSFGIALAAIREDEVAASAIGVPTTRYKLAALLISSFFSGVAGGLLAHVVWGGYVSPEVFGVHYSFNPVIYCVSGGLGTVEGPVVGAFLVTAVWEGLRFIGTYERLILVGAILILTVIFLPEGIFPTLRDRIYVKMKSPSS